MSKQLYTITHTMAMIPSKDRFNTEERRPSQLEISQEENQALEEIHQAWDIGPGKG